MNRLDNVYQILAKFITVAEGYVWAVDAEHVTAAKEALAELKAYRQGDKKNEKITED